MPSGGLTRFAITISTHAVGTAATAESNESEIICYSLSLISGLHNLTAAKRESLSSAVSVGSLHNFVSLASAYHYSVVGKGVCYLRLPI